MKNRDEILNLIAEERARQIELPGTEFDYKKTKNDWTSLAAYYLFETSTRNDKKVSFEEFREAMIKASATLLAALEHSFNHESKATNHDLAQEIMEKIRNSDDYTG